jgi:hypothetical protein
MLYFTVRREARLHVALFRCTLWISRSAVIMAVEIVLRVIGNDLWIP